MIDIESEGEVAILKLNRSITNPLNLKFLLKISGKLRVLKDDSSVRSVVLSSGNNKFFSIGFDIPELYELEKTELTDFYTTYNRLSIDLYTFPKPTVVAISGHAIAGGCILTLCCDHRIIAEGKKFMGLNEIKLGLPVPYPADCILRDLVDARTARDIMEEGEFYLPEKSLGMGIADQVVPLEEVISRSVEKAKRMGEMPREAYKIIKNNRVENVKARILKNLEEKEQLFFERWYSDDAQRLLHEAKEKF
ncbi:MAG: enoyl-CoA hydratase/isomerase family protein [Thermoplasmata archaeon]|nr:MAG: enoyl-CoA hydratase/isomerase family protein [Thermoplasmata archaeon]